MLRGLILDRNEALSLAKRFATEAGMEVRDVVDVRTDFHFVISEPNLPPVDVIHQRVDDAYVILASSLAVSEEHQKKLLALGNKERDELVWKIRFQLVSMGIEFRSEGGDGPPTMWRVFSRLYLEKASTQEFWLAYLSVKNASVYVSLIYMHSLP